MRPSLVDDFNQTAEIVWESEVWIAEFPDHMIHFNGDKFMGPYPNRGSPGVSSNKKTGGI
ncbi:MAG: BsuBI/PstI family type II restriction endonuclease [Pirellulaceae bacterium]